MKIMIVLVLLLASCIPAMAEQPDLTGNWSGVIDFVGYDKNTAWQPNETVSFWPGGVMNLTIDKQEGRMFSGMMVPSDSPLSREILLGVLGADNKSMTMVDENGYWWGTINSPNEIMFFYQEVNLEGMTVGGGVLKRV